MNRRGIAAVAVVLSVVLAGPSLTEGRAPTQSAPMPAIPGLGTPTYKLVLQRDFSCKAWFAKDSAGTPYPVPTIVKAWNDGLVWMFYSVTNKGTKTVKNVGVEAKIYAANYYPNPCLTCMPPNILTLQKIANFLSSVKYPTKTFDVPPGTTKPHFAGNIKFWPLWGGWAPGGIHNVSVKWNVQAHVLQSDKVCSAAGITLQYENLP